MSLNTAIRVLMLSQGENQKTLGDAVGIKPAMLSKKLNGTCRFSIEELRRILKHYRVTPDQLFAIFFEDEVA